MKNAQHDVLLMIADISGYTRFMVSHEKALRHSQMIIGKLMETIIEQVQDPLKVVKLEGDAVFMYASINDGGPELPAFIGRRIRSIFASYRREVDNLARTSICLCKACGDINTLTLKLIVHAGRCLITNVGQFTDLAGVPVIVVHRLLKNSVESDEYLLLTRDGWDAVNFGVDEADMAFIDGEEHSEGVGSISTKVVQIRDWLGDFKPMSEGDLDDAHAYEILRLEIQEEYSEVAVSPTKGFHFHTGRKLADILEYSEENIALVPTSALESFAGTGNPWSLGPISAGERVVDIGCGAGMDTFIASHHVGKSGRVIGVDMTKPMLQKARTALNELGCENVELREGFAEDLPVEDSWADVVISNGSFNLCPHKPEALSEMLRVLRPGGRLQIADIMVTKPIPESARRNIDLWTG